MEIRIGHSPDADDAFMFYALTQGILKPEKFSVRHCLEGIEQLNQRAMKGELEMTAVSLAAYPYCAKRYLLLPAGASVGDGVGPIVVAREAISPGELGREPVAVPGELTTATLLLQLAVGKVPFQVLPFDQILPAVAQGKVRAGVLIHEGQITFSRLGLAKVLDLGDWWAKTTGLPVPLGVNLVRRDLGTWMIQEIARLFRESLDYAFAHRQEALRYAMGFSRGLEVPATDRFVGMYVNRWTLDCRPEGAAAMQHLLDQAAEKGLLPERVSLEFAG